MKIIQITPQIGKGDLARKMKQAQKFLEGREQVRVTLVLRGRQRGKREHAVDHLLEIHEEFFEGYGKLVNHPSVDHLSLTYNPLAKR